jgi:parallel beta-helix repeat protein
MTGDGSFVERVTANGNAGPGIVVAGSAIECSVAGNGGFGVLAITVRECTAVQNAGDGIVVDGSGGVAISNIASFNGGRGMFLQNGSATGNTMVRNQGFGITAVCPSSILANTVIGNTLGIIETRNDGCVLANNSTRQ